MPRASCCISHRFRSSAVLGSLLATSVSSNRSSMAFRRSEADGLLLFSVFCCLLRVIGWQLFLPSILTQREACGSLHHWGCHWLVVAESHIKGLFRVVGRAFLAVQVPADVVAAINDVGHGQGDCEYHVRCHVVLSVLAFAFQFCRERIPMQRNYDL